MKKYSFVIILLLLSMVLPAQAADDQGVEDIKISQINESNINSTTATITWTTNIPTSFNYIIFDTSKTEYQYEVEETSGSRTNHSIKLTNLNPDTRYYYKLYSYQTQNSDNYDDSTRQYFSTNEAASTNAEEQEENDIKISVIKITDITTNSATITWKTATETSYNYVLYDTTNRYFGNKVTESKGYKTKHEVTLKNLLPASKYYFKIHSAIFSGSSEKDWSAITTFRTKPPAESDTAVEPKEIEVKDEEEHFEDVIELLVDEEYDQILNRINKPKDQNKENQTWENRTRHEINKHPKTDVDAQRMLNFYLAYGLDENSKYLGEGERLAVLKSYEEAYGDLPETRREFLDLLRINNGRFPKKASKQAIFKAKETFMMIYKRIYDETDQHDQAALNILAYGLKQKAKNRNLQSEQQAINTFRHIFKRQPSSTHDWNAVQCIAYSGAIRKLDSDKDFLTDVQELNYKTDPFKDDTDKDGYLDGIEVNYGYDPLGKGRL